MILDRKIKKRYKIVSLKDCIKINTYYRLKTLVCKA